MPKAESVFTKFIADTLEKDQPEKIPQVDLKMLPAGRLLKWILDSWDEPTISIKEICVYGPRPRIRKEAVSRAETLAQQGWLIPVKTRQHDGKKWRIVREMTTSPTKNSQQ